MPAFQPTTSQERTPMADAMKSAETQKGPREQTQPAEEWGERVATVRTIARGGIDAGAVPGAPAHSSTQQHREVVAPPAPPGESSPDAVRKTQAVANALTQLGENADPKRVSEAIKAEAGIDVSVEEVTAIRAVLRERARVPPGPDQPPPE